MTEEEAGPVLDGGTAELLGLDSEAPVLETWLAEEPDLDLPLGKWASSS